MTEATDSSTFETNEGMSLESMTIAKLREVARLSHIAYPRDATKEDLINLVRRKNQGRQIILPTDTSKKPQPGRYRVIIQKDPFLGKKSGSAPVSLFCNGYRCDIPRGIAVDIPEKALRVLENTLSVQVVDDPDNSGRNKIEQRPTYNYQVLDFTPGPDPAPGFEKLKEATYRPRERFWQLFGYWPSKSALRDAVKAGLIPMLDGEFIETTSKDT